MRMITIGLLALTLSACVLVPAHRHGGKSANGTVLVCHKHKKTLELPREAAQAHINHGDTYGPC